MKVARGAWSAALRSAVLYHWNLLYLAISGSVAVISGRPDVVLPLAGAAEILYLAVLSTNSRYQDLVTAIEQEPGELEQAKAQKNPDEILDSLTKGDRDRYQALAKRCTQLRRLAAGDTKQEPLGIPDLQLHNIDRLLRILLRLLGVKGTLERFFAAVDEDQLQRDLDRTQQRLAALKDARDDSAHQSKSRAAIQDTLSTIQMRLKNLAQARENYEYILLEQERLHAKISGIAELGIDRQDAASVGREIELVTSSVEVTEQTMSKIEGLARDEFAEMDEPDPPAPPPRRRRERH